MKNLILTLFIVFNLNGLFSQEQETQVSNGITLIDQVSKKQKKRKIMSLLITSCKYGIYQISDKQLTEDRFSILKKNLLENTSGIQQYDSIFIKNFTIHINSARSLKGAVRSMGNKGPIADLMIKDEKVGCSNDDLFGSYNLKEIPKDLIEKEINPLIIVIDFEINGKFYHTRTLSVTEKTLKPKKKFPEFTEFIDQSIKKNCLKLSSLLNN